MCESVVTLADLPEYLHERLVAHFGSEERAEEWFQADNSGCGGVSPASVVAKHGPGWLADITCNWPIEDTGRFPAVVSAGC